jgi:hypothetical protein
MDAWFAENPGSLQKNLIQLQITKGVRNFKDGDFTFTTNDEL